MRRHIFFLIAGLVLAADQISKWQVRRVFVPNATHQILPEYFDFTFVQNPGGAFGIFRNSTQLLAVACALAVIAIIVFVVRSTGKLSPILGVALALPMGGAIGNLIDRVRFGWVTDFIHVHAGAHEFPVFNIADSAICIGVGLLVIYSWSSPPKTEPPLVEAEKN